jgi:hypothetical protein
MSLDPLSALFELGKTAIEKIWPDPSKRAEELFKLEQLKQAGDLAKLDAEVKLLLGQIEINKIEAQHPSLFVAGWRPAAGWCGAFAFAYAAIIEPVARFVAKVGYGYQGNFPEINTDLTIQVLLGMLGLGLMRSFEKTKDVQTDRTEKR